MNSIYLDMNKLTQYVEESYRRHLIGTGVDVIAAHCLCILHQNKPLRASDLAQAVGFAPTNFTPRIDMLEKRGLLRRCPDSGDRRSVRLEITEEGAALAARIADRLTAAQLELQQALLRLAPGAPRLFLTRYAPIADDQLPSSFPG